MERYFTAQEFAEFMPAVWNQDRGQIRRWVSAHVTTTGRMAQFMSAMSEVIADLMRQLDVFEGRDPERFVPLVIVGQVSEESRTAGQLITTMRNGDRDTMRALIVALLQDMRQTQDMRRVARVQAALIKTLGVAMRQHEAARKAAGADVD